MVMESEKYTLKVSEMARRHGGLGRAVVDPQVVETANWTTGQILEVSYGKTTFVRLWPGSVLYRSGVIEIDGITRQNAGAGIGDRVIVRSSTAHVGREVVLSPTENVQVSGLGEFVQQNYVNRVMSLGDGIIAGTHLGYRVQLIVVSTKPSSPVIIDRDTRIIVGKPGMSAAAPGFTYDDLGGLDTEIKKIREMVELPLRHPELFEKVGVDAPKGVLLYGPPGTGKTLLARAVAGETSANFLHVSGPEIMGKYHGESEERLRDIFRDASENAPSIIFIDEIDSIAPKRDDVAGEVEKRVVSQLLTLMDGLKNRGKVVVVAATNRPDSIDPALRRGGRFDREMEIGIPDYSGRQDILRIHTHGMPLVEVDLDQIARVTHGFVGADLQALSKEAAMSSLRRIMPKIDLEQERISPDILQQIQIVPEDFRGALREVRPSALREVLVQVPDVKWSDVGGLDRLKADLREATEWPLKYADAFKHVDATSPKGIMLHGPPGTGKTLVAKALAHETDSNFISIKGPELLSKWVGESEKGIREVFRKARQAAPCVIFFDEMDSLTPRRGMDMGTHVTENVVSQILSEMDGLEELHDVVVVGATNRVDMIDEALLRPGRFDLVIEVPSPDSKGRAQILRIHTRNKPLSSNVDFGALVESTDGFTGAQLMAVTNIAAMSALRRYVECGSSVNDTVILMDDLERAVKKIKFVPN